ncbi:MAG: POTRA domain-containing protein [Candidatus Caenarcaniphilales bacterium]|nr:POTRA domain-containing protein [Candidatus Caenarcaniphilales bacterium]
MSQKQSQKQRISFSSFFLFLLLFINLLGDLPVNAKLPWSKNNTTTVSPGTSSSRAQNTTLTKDENPLEELSKPSSQIVAGPSQGDLDESDLSDPNESFGNFDRAVTIKQIQVVGNQLVPTDVILDSMRTKVGTKFSRRKIAYDLQNLNNLGYFDKDKLLAVPVPNGNEGVVLRIQVVENKPITGLIIKGNELVDKSEVEQFLSPVIGMPRSTSQIRKAVEKIEKVYHDKGYLLAAVTELHFDPDGFLTVSIDEGKIEDIEFEGNSRTKSSYLNKILPAAIKPGQAYNEENVIKFMENLQKSGFFKDVKREIKPSPNDPFKHIVSFKLEEQRTKALSIGTGVGTLNGFFGTLSFTEPNFRGQGENLSFSGQAGTGLLSALDGDTDGRFVRRGDYRFTLNWTDPFVGDSNVAMSSNVSAQQFGSFIVDSAFQRTLRAGLTVSTPLERFNKEGKGQWSLQNGLSLSDNTVTRFGRGARDTLVSSLITKEGLSSDAATAEAERLRDKQTKDGIYLDLTPSLIFRKFDETGSGWRNTFFGGPSLGLGGAGSYLSAGIDVRRYQRLTEDGWYFKNASHAEGLFGNPAGFRNLKMGGPYGMRGYRQFRDAGIGTTMLTNTAEFSVPFSIPKGPIKDVKMILFNDVGLVGGQSRLNRLYGRRGFAASIGAGLEINIPLMGPIRFDYGIPLVGKSFGFDKGRIHVNVGSQL